MDRLSAAMDRLSAQMLRPIVLAAVLTSAGCYAYIPAAPADPSLWKAPIQLSLTDSGAVVLAPLVGPSIVTLEGQLVADSGATYVVSMSKASRRDGSEIDWRGERVTVPHVLVAGVAARHFSRTRTLAFSALATGVLVGITEAFVGTGSASAPGPTPGGPGTGK